MQKAMSRYGRRRDDEYFNSFTSLKLPYNRIYRKFLFCYASAALTLPIAATPGFHVMLPAYCADDDAYHEIHTIWWFQRCRGDEHYRELLRCLSSLCRLTTGSFPAAASYRRHAHTGFPDDEGGRQSKAEDIWMMMGGDGAKKKAIYFDARW